MNNQAQIKSKSCGSACLVLLGLVLTTLIAPITACSRFTEPALTPSLTTPIVIPSRAAESPPPAGTSLLPTLAPISSPTTAASLSPVPTILGATATAIKPIATSPAEPAGFDPVRAMTHLQLLAVQIGRRVAGSPDGYRAGDYIAMQFAADGLQVQKQEFPIEAWEDRGTHVQLVGAALELEAQPIQKSPAGKLEAEVVAAPGTGEPGDYTGLDARGKIVLVARGVLPFSDKARNAIRAGAVAVLIYNNATGLYGGTLREPVSIPVLALSQAAGNQLLAALKQGAVRVHLESDTVVLQRRGRNIIGTKPGDPAHVIIFGGHYDSVQAGPGANDNGSGTAVLLELARVLAASSRPETLVFIGFDGEEFGLLGSSYYVEHLPQEAKARLRAMLNFDMLAAGSGPLLLGGDGPISADARRAAVELGIENRKFQLPPNSGSDHAPFQAAGIDSVFFSRDYTLLHTPQDTIDKVHIEWLAEAGAVAQRALEELTY